ncbi:MAG TPA: tetratricopeptide repeat protein [Candidatus Polarisedimenticolia bacterium]|nr:tetratricopeptide repeat protein [Candidatus Polarisedimenticolia bacterium]
MKKDERHQLKRDELLTVIERGALYFADHARQVSLIAGAAAALALAGFALTTWSGSRDERASLLLGNLIRTYRAPVAASLEAIQQAPSGVHTYGSTDERDRRVLELADEILAKHAGARYAPKALYYKGLALTALKRTDEASQTFDELLRRYPADFIAPMARFSLARLRETQGKRSEALIQFQALADDARALFPRAEALLGMARCQEGLGNRQEALKTYQRILSDYPDSDYQGEARRKVQELS